MPNSSAPAAPSPPPSPLSPPPPPSTPSPASLSPPPPRFSINESHRLDAPFTIDDFLGVNTPEVSDLRQKRRYSTSPESDLDDDRHAALPLSGVFFHGAFGEPVYAPFHPDLRLLALSFLPEPVTVHASTAGLLCCRGRETRRYYICNPLTTKWARLPPPNNFHGTATALLLVLDEDSEYRLVCVYTLLDDVQCLNGIETFDSRRWEWEDSEKMIDVDVVADSGVAVGGAAYWRTEDWMVVSYVAAIDEVLLTVPPEGAVSWDLGELDGRVCCISLTGITAGVWVLEGVDGWTEVLHLDVGPGQRTVEVPLTIRSQGGSDLLFWEDLTSCSGRQVVARNVATGRVRRLEALADNAPQPGDELVPFVSSVIHIKSVLGFMPGGLKICPMTQRMSRNLNLGCKHFRLKRQKRGTPRLKSRTVVGF